MLPLPLAMRWKAVIFDMDGLMLDTERISRDAWRAAAASMDVAFRDDWLVHIVGRSMRDIAGVMSRLGGPAYPVVQFMETASNYYHEAIAGGDIPVKPGLVELLDWLDAHEVPRVVATSTHEPTAAHKLEVTGLRPRFHGLMTGDRVTHGKPAPDIFEAAARLMGVTAQDCLVLEDSENGIRGAHAAGAYPVLVPDYVVPSAEVRALASQVFTDLHAVRQWLAAGGN